MDSTLPTGNIRINDIRLISFERNDISILNLFREVELIEDINNSIMFGRIVMSEPNNLPESFPIIGEEWIQINYSIASDIGAPKRELEFRVTGVSNIHKPKDKQHDYEINFCTSEYYYLVQKSIDVRKTGLVEDMVSDILREDVFSEKHLYYEPTKRRQSILFPGMSLMDAINYCSFRAQGKASSDSLYKFFETPDGFHFVSVGYMNSKEPEFNIKYKQLNVQEPGDTNADNVFSAMAYSVMSRSDTANMVYNGGFKNSALLFDPLIKTKAHVTKDYYETPPVQTQDKPINSLAFSDLAGVTDSIEYAFVTNLRPSPRPTSDNPADMYVPGYEAFYLDRQMSRVRMGDTVLQLTLPITTRLQAGQTVNFDLPKDNSTDRGGENDKYLSGKYLVTKVTHTFNSETGVTNIEMRKSGLQNDIGRDE